MKISAEYTITLKIEDLPLKKDSTSDEIKEFIIRRGRESLNKYFNGALFDPDKKIIHEDVKFENII